MISRSESQILSVYHSDIFSGMTIRGLSLSLGKPYPHVHKHVHALLRQGILVKNVVGPSFVCRLNLASEAGRLATASTALEHTQRAVGNRSSLRQVHAELVERLRGHQDAIVLFENNSLRVLVHDCKQVKQELKGFKSKYPISVQPHADYFLRIGHELEHPLILLGHYHFFEELGRTRLPPRKVVVQ